MKLGWHRVTRARRCEICGKPDWCMWSDDGNAVICPRTEAGHYRDLGEAGYLHYMKGAPSGSRHRLPTEWKVATERKADMPFVPDDLPDMSALAIECQLRITDNQLETLASQLHLPEWTLERLEVGITEKGGWTFPMQGFDQIIGISIRGSNGRKWCVPGSRNGLFVPQGLSGNGRLLICEGATDTAAMLGMGYDVVGRQGCKTGAHFHYLIPLVEKRSVVIIADNDGPGQSGARDLADKLWQFTTEVKIVTPLYRKDAREWVNSGASRKSIDAIIDAANTWSLT